MAILIICACIATISASGIQETEKPIRLTFMHGWGGSSADHVAMRSIFESFADEHPEILFVTDSYPDLNIVLSKLNDAQAIGIVPDIVSINGDALSYENAIKRSLAMDIAPYLATDADFASDVSDTLLESLSDTGNHLYTMPEVIEVIGYWYNRDVLLQAGITSLPSTWETLLADMERVRATGAQAVMLDRWQLSLVFCAALASQSEQSLAFMQGRGDTVPLVDVQEAIDIIVKISELGRHGLSTISARDFFYAGEVAFYFNGVWANPQMSTSENQQRLLPASYPGLHGKSAAFVSATPGFMVSAEAEQPVKDAAVKFLKYMVSEPVQRRIYEQTGQVPQSTKIPIDEMVAVSPVLGNAIKSAMLAPIHLLSYSNVLDSSTITALHELCEEPTNGELQLRLLEQFGKILQEK